MEKDRFKTRSTLNKLIRAIALIAALLAFVLYGYNVFDHNALVDLRIEYKYIFLSIALFTLHYLGKYFLWHLLSKYCHCSIMLAKAIFARSISEFGKYLPGKVWMYVFIYTQYSDAGYERKSVLWAVYYDMFCQIAGVSIGLLFLVFTFDHDLNLPVWAISPASLSLAYFLLLLSLSPFVLTTILGRFLGDKDLQPTISHFRLILLTHGYFVNVITFIVGVYFLLLGIGMIGFTFTDVLIMSLVYMGASLLGLLAFFAPGGIGVREASFIYFLALEYPKDDLFIISMVVRILLIIAEAILFLGALFAKSVLWNTGSKEVIN